MKLTAISKYVSLLALSLLFALPALSPASELRRSAIVKAIARAKPSVVNIHGQKTVPADNSGANGQREVNGMGTGVVIDERGYIVTNYHVVDGVRQINVTMADGEAYVARLVAHDRNTDLAIIKVPARKPMELISIGRSHDLMIGEEVIAIGNAYGYEHTHTRGIISALHRTVKVTDHQYYSDLIQTDASINPGNSGGPLLNVDGDMIAINVAVRVGAQGIGFAIPSDHAMDVAARLLSAERNGGVWHGIVTKPSRTSTGLLTSYVHPGSPAARAGIVAGDLITKINSVQLQRTLDLERSMIGLKPGQQIRLQVERDQHPRSVQLTLAAAQRVHRVSAAKPVLDQAWTHFGMQLSRLDDGELPKSGTQFTGGLKVTAVRPNSAAAREGVVAGDILVGLHEWVTTSPTDLSYALTSDAVNRQASVKFYIQRGDAVLFGHLPTDTLR